MSENFATKMTPIMDTEACLERWSFPALISLGRVLYMPNYTRRLFSAMYNTAYGTAGPTDGRNAPPPPEHPPHLIIKYEEYKTAVLVTVTDTGHWNSGTECADTSHLL